MFLLVSFANATNEFNSFSRKRGGELLTMVKQVITTSYPPRMHYSRAIKTEQFIFVAGTAGDKEPDTGEEIKGIEAQTRRCLETIKEVLESAGSSLNDVVSTNVYLVNPDDHFKYNEVYKTYFPKDPPARATVVTGLLWPGMLIEIQCVACYSSSQ